MVRGPRLAVLASLMCLAFPAAASAQSDKINGTPLDLYMNAISGMDVNFNADSGFTTEDFFEAGQGGFFVRLSDGTRWDGIDDYCGSICWTPDSAFQNPPVSGAGTPSDPYVLQRYYRGDRNGGTDLQVHQFTRYVNGDTTYRQTYIVKNVSGQPLVFRALSAGDLNVDGSETGTGVFTNAPGVPRFAGGTTASNVSGGTEEVTSSRLPGETTATPIAPWAGWEVNTWPQIYNNLIPSAGGMTNFVVDSEVDDAVGIEWEDHNTVATALPAGAEARYEVVWRVRQPLPLRLRPTVASPELGTPHRVLATLRDTLDQPLANKPIRWTITGKNPQSGSGTTDDLGQTTIEWTGSTRGLDSLLAWYDVDGGGEPSPEPEDTPVSATANWRTPSEVDPPAFDSATKLQVLTNPARPLERELVIAKRDTGYDKCPDPPDSYRVKLNLTVNVKPAVGDIKNAQVELLVLDRNYPNANNPLQTFQQTGPPTDSGDHKFYIECLRSGIMTLRYTVVEQNSSGGSDEQLIDFPIGGITLIDPQGVVHDGEVYDRLRAEGKTEDEARAGAAIPGATVRLQRLFGSEYHNLLAGDPGIAPNVNPQITGPNGLFQWDVAAGSYRVVVTAPGYPDVISRVVGIPPPVLDLHVAMRKPDADGDGVSDANDACPSVSDAAARRSPRTGCPADAAPTRDLCPTQSASALTGCPLIAPGAKKPTAGNDVLVGDALANVICGLGGNDRIDGLGGDDTLFGDACSKKARTAFAGVAAFAGAARDGNDKLNGGDGNDKLYGAGGNDVLAGGKGNDKLFGGAGVNKYKGGSGNDTIAARNRKKETVDCGPGKRDNATVDKKDKVKGCEKVKRAKK